jgi:hypothetical protein
MPDQRVDRYSGQIGHGWYPGYPEDDVQTFAIRELRILLKEIFDIQAQRYKERCNEKKAGR